jgi:transcriptional regulator with XRE-family HTH domain
MATVHYEADCRDDFDDSDEVTNNPFAVADSEHSDVARAASEYDDQPAEQQRPPQRRLRKRMHRISEVRQRQGVTLRNVARRLGIELSVVRRQEQPDSDLRLSELMLWQSVLEVPIAELLVEGEGQLSGPVLERSRMVKLMKTAAAIRERTSGTPVGRTVDMLVEQILEIMPELRDVTPWNTVGQRRTLDDVGRTARYSMPDDIFRRPPQ